MKKILKKIWGAVLNFLASLPSWIVSQSKKQNVRQALKGLGVIGLIITLVIIIINRLIILYHKYYDIIWNAIVVTIICGAIIFFILDKRRSRQEEIDRWQQEQIRIELNQIEYEQKQILMDSYDTVAGALNILLHQIPNVGLMLSGLASDLYMPEESMVTNLMTRTGETPVYHYQIPKNAPNSSVDTKALTTHLTRIISTRSMSGELFGVMQAPFLHGGRKLPCIYLHEVVEQKYDVRISMVIMSPQYADHLHRKPANLRWGNGGKLYEDL